jgi:hypothetical protein
MLIPVVKVSGDTPRDGRRHYLPLARVDYMIKPTEDELAVGIKDLKGTIWRAAWSDVFAISNPIVGTLPVVEGTFLLIAHYRKSTGFYEIDIRYPVLGWLVRASGKIEPAIATGHEYFLSGTETVILHPSGLIEMLDGGFYDNEELWFENLNAGTVRPK